MNDLAHEPGTTEVIYDGPPSSVAGEGSGCHGGKEQMRAAAAAAFWLLPPRRFAMNRLRW